MIVINKKMLLAFALFAFAGVATFAQTAAPQTSNPAPIQNRKTDQQDRISNGVQDGQLTPGESKNLEAKEAGINHEERNMRSQDDGHLTAADRTKINNQQNRLSNRIYTDKHNAAATHYGPGEVGQRERSQQDRIAQGMKSGQLTPGETARLERQQQSINREKNGMRAANGGKLTAGAKAALNRRQNRASGNVYAKKHNRRS